MPCFLLTVYWDKEATRAGHLDRKVSLFVEDLVSLYSFGCPRTCSVGQSLCILNAGIKVGIADKALEVF